MSLREKFAWTSLLTMLLVVILYVATLTLAEHGVLERIQTFYVLLGSIVALIVLPPTIRACLALRMPSGSMTEQDERERLFELRATRIAYFVLAIGVLLITFFTVHGSAHRHGIAHGVVSPTVLAYLAKFGAEIVYHRRGY